MLNGRLNKPVSGTSRLLSCIVATVMVCSVARAEKTRLVARQDFSVDSSFTLDFGEEGGVASSQITRTEFVVDVDFENETAEFLFYDQDVEPLMIPFPGGALDTGPIGVVIVASHGGTYDAFNEEFSSTDDFAVHFDDENLAPLGITSPFVLQSTSVGTITFDDEAETGTVRFNWVGEFSLPVPTLPGVEIPFSYICQVNTVFRIPSVGNTDGDLDVDLRDFALLQSCLGGEGESVHHTRCALADLDRDGDVDLDDHPLLSDNVTGPMLIP